MDLSVQIVLGLIVLVFTGFVIRDAQRPVGSTDGLTWIQYGTTFRICAVFGLGMTVLIAADGIRRGTPVTGLATALAFGMLALPFFSLAFFWRVGYDTVGLRCISPWRRNRLVPWSEVTSVSFSIPMKQWRLSTRSQGVIRVNELVPGCSQLLSELRKRGLVIGDRHR